MLDKNIKTILLVEDEVLIAMSEETSLKAYGYNVITSNTGEEALDEFRNNTSIDLVLMDIDLGAGIDGPETAIMMLAIRTIPVVFLSSHTEPDIVAKTEKITSYGYVVKNSGITVLDASIKMAFRLFEANKQIAESENKQKAMISNISDVIGIIGADGIMKYKSPNIEKLFGWKPEDLVGTNGFDTVHPDDLKRIKNVFYTLLEQYDLSQTVEYNYKCKDGSYRPVELTAVNCIHNPAINGILLNYKDISERKATADALKTSEERYIKAQRIGHVGNWEYNLQTARFWGSDEAKRIYGFDPEKTDFSTEEVENCILERERVHQALVDLIREGKEYNLEFEIHPKDNSAPRIIWSVAEMQRDDNGDPQLITGVVQDITDRTKAEEMLTRKNQELNAIMEELEATNEQLNETNEELNATNEELLNYQNELTARESELQHMFRSMINAFVLFESVFDENGTFVSYRFIYINDAYEKITGVKNDEVRGKTVHEVWPGTEASWVEAYGSVAVTGIQKSFEMFHEPTGNLYYCNVYRPWDTTDRFCVIFEDITDRTRIEQELRKSEEKYRNLFENMVHGVFYQSADGTLVDINPAGLDMFGLTRDQFMGRTSYHEGWKVVDEKYNILQPEEHPSMVALRTAQDVKVVVGVFNPVENSYRWLSVNAKPQFKNGDPRPHEVFVTMYDITEQKNAEILLRESELKYRSLIENSSDVVFCVNEKGEYQFTNKTFAATFGQTPDYFIGKSFWDIYPKEHADHRQGASKKVFETGEPQSVEVTVPLPDRTLYYLAKANPIKDETGRVFLNLTTATDITDRKVAEDKIKSLLSEKELILKEVHHRIKNNMNTLISLLSLQAGAAKEPAVTTALEDAGSRVKSMLVLYDQLYQSASFQELPVNEYLPALISQIVRNFPNSGSVRIEHRIDKFILDSKILSTIGMILNELLTNIMKYAFSGRNGGLIAVSAARTGNHISLIIRDNGTGMPESVDFENSTGFGLMLVKILTQQLNGSIHIDRSEGTGITLEFDVQ